MLSLFLFYRILKWIFRLLLAFIAISLLWVIAYRFINPPSTALMRSRGNLYDTECNQTWVSYDDIGNNIKMAVICGEDQRFKEHYGFDFKAIQKAIQHNMSGGKVRGASTISQQCDLLCFPYGDSDESTTGAVRIALAAASSCKPSVKVCPACVWPVCAKYCAASLRWRRCWPRPRPRDWPAWRNETVAPSSSPAARQTRSCRRC